MMRAIIFVIDGFGVGEMPDAKDFGDEGSSTYGNIKKQVKMFLPNLRSLGLDGIMNEPCEAIGAYGKMFENAKAKDTTAGHWEMAGIEIKKPFVTFPNGIPSKLVENLEKAWGTKSLFNGVASGTVIINQYGDEHLKSGYPIVYTSADSVVQIACHTNVYPVEKLYELCEKARKVCVGEFEVGRVIARPFDGTTGNYVRTPQRHDFSVLPPENMLTKILRKGYKTVGVGKIFDIFAGKDVCESYPLKGNEACIKQTIELIKTKFDGVLFVNLIDTDMQYGHRNDVVGYARSLEDFDAKLPEIFASMQKDDILIITGDHGNDPTTPSTDHSREFGPLMIYGFCVKPNVALGERKGFDTISETILDYLDIEKGSKSLMKEIKK
ncbi:MAG: phosphopentomutase [Clostridia bacterium]